MEKIIKKVYLSDKDEYINAMKKFDWNLISCEEKGQKVILTFERDNETPYYNELVALENRATLKVIPNYVLLILMLISISLMTTFVILAKVKGEEFKTLKYFLIIFLPAILLLTSMLVISFVRNKQISNFVINESNIKREINAKLEELRNKYEHKEN